MKESAEELFLYAEQKLKDTANELFRPEEDVVAYSVCNNVQFAVENYLKGFLTKKGIDPKGYSSIESLYEHCLLINPKFGEIDMTNFNCKTHSINSKYCIDHFSANNCYEIAETLSSFLKRSGLNRVKLNTKHIR